MLQKREQIAAKETDLHATATGEIDSRTTTSMLQKREQIAAKETDLHATATGEIDFPSRTSTSRLLKQ